MGKMQRDKGARFERLLVSIFHDYGYKDAYRTAQRCGKQGNAPDVDGLPLIHVEAKHQEKMSLYDWIEQARRDSMAGGGGKIPAVFHKKNNAEILVTMTLPDWMRIYKEFESGMTLERYRDGSFCLEESEEIK